MKTFHLLLSVFFTLFLTQLSAGQAAKANHLKLEVQSKLWEQKRDKKPSFIQQFLQRRLAKRIEKQRMDDPQTKFNTLGLVGTISTIIGFILSINTSGLILSFAWFFLIIGFTLGFIALIHYANRKRKKGIKTRLFFLNYIAMTPISIFLIAIPIFLLISVISHAYY